MKKPMTTKLMTAALTAAMMMSLAAPAMATEAVPANDINDATSSESASSEVTTIKEAYEQLEKADNAYRAAAVEYDTAKKTYQSAKADADSLAEQAEEAKNTADYLKEEADAYFAYAKEELLPNAKAAADQALVDATTKMEAASNTFDEAAADLDTKKAAFDQAKQNLMTAAENNGISADEVAKIQEEIESAQAKVNEINDQIDAANKELNTAETEVGKKQDYYQNLANYLSEAEAELPGYKAEAETAKAEYDALLELIKGVEDGTVGPETTDEYAAYMEAKAAYDAAVAAYENAKSDVNVDDLYKERLDAIDYLAGARSALEEEIEWYNENLPDLDEDDIEESLDAQAWYLDRINYYENRISELTAQIEEAEFGGQDVSDLIEAKENAEAAMDEAWDAYYAIVPDYDLDILKSKEIGYAIALECANDDVTDCENDIAALKEAMEKAQTEIDGYNETIDACNKTLDELEPELAAANKAVADAEEKFNGVSDALSAYKEAEEALSEANKTFDSAASAKNEAAIDLSQAEAAVKALDELVIDLDSVLEGNEITHKDFAYLNKPASDYIKAKKAADGAVDKASEAEENEKESKAAADDALTKMNDAWNKLTEASAVFYALTPSYNILQSSNTFTKGKDNAIICNIESGTDVLVKVEIDGVDVTEKINAAGGTISIPALILNNLSAGNHTVKIVYEYGDNSVNIIVKEAESAAKEEYVSRLYKTFLNRRPDETGLKDWTEKLENKQSSATDIAKGVIFSKEYTALNKSDEDFLTDMYRALFDRKPDKTGSEYWLKKMAEGMSREDVFNGFAASNEFKNTCDKLGVEYVAPAPKDPVNDFVTRMYNTCLSRKPETAGMKYWVDGIKSGKYTGAQVAESFVFSKELTAKKLNDDAFVETLYVSILGRSSDKIGKAYWLDKLEKGTSREAVLAEFTDSKEFAKLCGTYGIKVK